MWSKNPNISAVKFEHFPIFLYRDLLYKEVNIAWNLAWLSSHLKYLHDILWPLSCIFKPTFSLTDNSDNKGDSWGYDPWPKGLWPYRGRGDPIWWVLKEFCVRDAWSEKKYLNFVFICTIACTWYIKIKKNLLYL